MFKKKGFFDKMFHKDKTGKKAAIFALKTTFGTLVFFLVMVTFVLGAGLAPTAVPAIDYDVDLLGGRGGLRATSTQVALAGEASTSNSTSSYGIYGFASSDLYIESGEGGQPGDAIGVYAYATSDNGYPDIGGNAYGVWGDASSLTDGGQAVGVYGRVVDFTGSSYQTFGVKGEVFDYSDSGFPGAYDYFGVYGFYMSSGLGDGFAVYGEISGAGDNSAAIYGKGESNNYAGYFEGVVNITGELVLDTSGHSTSTVCSVEGGIYYNSSLSEICFCNGANWMKAAATSTLCQ